MSLNQRDPNENYSRQVDCLYKGQRYSVRDNGAVKRDDGIGLFPDDEWSFGGYDSRGLFLYKGVSVAKVVATAFFGDAPSEAHFVDHLDEDIENNRPENLRWIDNIEYLLDSKETVEHILRRYGSIDAFVRYPSGLGHEGKQYGRFMATSPRSVLESIEHLVELSEEKPLKSGDFYVKWINDRKAFKESLKDAPEEEITQEQFRCAWSDLIEENKGLRRLAFFLANCEPECRRDEDGCFTVCLNVGNESQIRWLKEHKVNEFELFLEHRLNNLVHIELN